MTIDLLAARLFALGLRVQVEARDRQLVLAPREGNPSLADATIRDAVVAVARSAGFTHVSLEIAEDDANAPLYRDQPD